MVMSTDQIIDKLSRHPELLHRVGHILEIIESPDGRTTLADDAEERVIEEMRELGKEVLEKWPKDEPQRRENTLLKSGLIVNKKQKKTLLAYHLWNSKRRRTDFYHPGLKKSLRVFSPSAGIHCRGYSRALQRAITDFGG